MASLQAKSKTNLTQPLQTAKPIVAPMSNGNAATYTNNFNVPVPTMQANAIPVANPQPLVAGAPINPATINAQALTLPQQAPNTQAASNIGYFTNFSNGIAQQQQALDQQVAQAQKGVNEGSSAVQSVYQKLLGFGNRKEEIYKEQNVDPLQQIQKNALQSLQAEQEGLQSQIESINQNKGTFGGSNQRDISEAQRQSAIKQGRLSMTLAFATQNYQAASDIAERQIANELEPLKTQLDATKFFYQENKDTLDKKEQRQYETLTKSLDREYQQAYDDKKATQEILIDAAQQGAPLDLVQQAQAAQTPEEAARILGKYSSAYLQRQTELLQQQNIRSQIAERASIGNENGTIDGKPQNATQSSANSYANRLNESEVTLANLGGNFTGITSRLWNPNFIKSADRQNLEQAERNFVTAVLRRESGAAISPSEFDTERLKYFPQPGDKPETVDIKEKARNTAINNFYREANVPRPTLPGQKIKTNDGTYIVNEDGSYTKI